MVRVNPHGFPCLYSFVFLAQKLRTTQQRKCFAYKLLTKHKAARACAPTVDDDAFPLYV